MTIKEFLTGLQGYYGKYTEFTRLFIYEYLKKKNFNEKQLDLIFDKIIRMFSSQYKTCPDIAVIEQAISAAKIGQVIVGNDLYEDGVKIASSPNGCDWSYLKQPEKHETLIDYNVHIKNLFNRLELKRNERMKQIKNEKNT